MRIQGAYTDASFVFFLSHFLSQLDWGTLIADGLLYRIQQCFPNRSGVRAVEVHEKNNVMRRKRENRIGAFFGNKNPKLGCTLDDGD